MMLSGCVDKGERVSAAPRPARCEAWRIAVELATRGMPIPTRPTAHRAWFPGIVVKGVEVRRCDSGGRCRNGKPLYMGDGPRQVEPSA